MGTHIHVFSTVVDHQCDLGTHTRVFSTVVDHQCDLGTHTRVFSTVVDHQCGSPTNVTVVNLHLSSLQGLLLCVSSAMHKLTLFKP